VFVDPWAVSENLDNAKQVQRFKEMTNFLEYKPIKTLDNWLDKE